MYSILIVDDEKMIRMGIKNSIPWDMIGVGEVYTAASAKEALEVMRDRRPEIVVTDISMSEMTGLELIEEIRKWNEDCKIIVLTGYDRFDYARQALKLRVQDFLLKPIDEEELKSCIGRQAQALDEEGRQRREKELARRTRGFSEQTRLEMYLGDLIAGKEMESVREADFFAEFSFEPERRMRIGILLPSISGDDTNENQFFRFWTMKNICMGALDEQDAGITFSDGGGRILLALFADNQDKEASERAAELIELLESECGGRVRIILGSEQQGFRNLNISYNDAVFTLENEKKQWGEIVKTEWEQKRDHMFRETYQEFEKAALGSMNNPDQFQHIFERFRQSLESYNVSSRYAGRCCFNLASSVYFSYIAQTGDSVDERLDGLLRALSGADRESAGRVTEQFFRKLLTKERGDEHELVSRVKNLINADLAADLSVSSLAASVYVTANYLSRIFKRTTGEGCNEYIVRKRIEKAKSLLETTTLKTGEIAGMVGYHDMNYFSLAFKKQTGMSPTKYREDILKR